MSLSSFEKVDIQPRTDFLTIKVGNLCFVQIKKLIYNKS